MYLRKMCLQVYDVCVLLCFSFFSTCPSLLIFFLHVLYPLARTLLCSGPYPQCCVPTFVLQRHARSLGSARYSQHAPVANLEPGVIFMLVELLRSAACLCEQILLEVGGVCVISRHVLCVHVLVFEVK